MAEKIMERLFGTKRQAVISPAQATPSRLANDPPLTVRLSEEQSERLRELEEHGPAAR